MKTRERSNNKTSYKQTVCEDLLLRGHVQSFIEFFSIVHNPTGSFSSSSFFQNDDDTLAVSLKEGEGKDDDDEQSYSSQRQANDDFQPLPYSSHSLGQEKEYNCSYGINETHYEPLSSNNKGKNVGGKDSNVMKNEANVAKKDINGESCKIKEEDGEVAPKRGKKKLKKDVTFCTEVSYQDDGGNEKEKENGYSFIPKQRQVLLREKSNNDLENSNKLSNEKDSRNHSSNNDMKKESFAISKNDNITTEKNNRNDALSFIRNKLVEAECAAYENNVNVCIDSYVSLANFFETRQQRQPQQCPCQQSQQQEEKRLQLQQKEHSEQQRGGVSTPTNLKKSFYFYLKCLDIHKQNNNTYGQMESYHHLGRLLTKIILQNEYGDGSSKKSIDEKNCSDGDRCKYCRCPEVDNEERRSSEEWFDYSVRAVRYHECHMILAREVNDVREKERAGKQLVDAYLNHARRITGQCCNHRYDEEEEKNCKIKKREEALQFYLKSIESARAVGDKKTECIACGEVVEVYIALGQDKKGKKYERLHQHLHRMLSSQKKIGEDGKNEE